MRLAPRMSRLGTETAFEVLAQAKALEAQGRKIVHLEIGEPDFNTPQHIVDAAVRALREGWHHYTPSSGIRELRETIAEEISSSRGIPVDAEQVVVTPGAKPIIFFSLLALVEQGDEVIYPNPGFPIYESMIEYAGARAVPIALREELDFRLDVDELFHALTPRTRMVILNSPSNPTGSVLSENDLARLAEVLAERDLVVLSDEIYSHILYQGHHQSIASFPGMKERTIILDGFSKTYAMTGWRLGYGVMRGELAQQITKLMVNSNSCTAAFTQVAGVSALKGDQAPVSEMVERFRRRRDGVLELLNQIEGVSCRTPRGAFYVFPNVRSLGLKSSELAGLLLHEAGVALLSGTSFGEYGEGYLRISYATSMEKLQEGIQRIAEAGKKLLVRD
ncbi:pyridoxal phosphate-dependent aminotransferase [Acidobacteria bacterium AH-259-G07]|nr:pyridoxal phosphate-dependent aminotransferase [Acidobacteria bacterium AH-259-G07]